MMVRVRRPLIIGAVVASLLLGVASIRVASHLTALAAAPAAPPISLTALQSQLDAERARSTALEQQLADLLDATGALRSALDSTQDQVSLDGLTADQLRDRLVSAQARLASVTALLLEAEARLASAQGGTTPGAGTPAGGSGPAAGSSPTPSSVPTLTLALVAGGVQASWSQCPSAGFDSAVLVRSLDPEIHYPPEDGDSVVARVTSLTTTTATDSNPPAGTRTYRLYCLTVVDGETFVGAKSSSHSIAVP
jgi:hypothetical protein